MDQPGDTVSYEDLTADPEQVSGGWSDDIKSGWIQAPKPPTAELPDELRQIAEMWGYRRAACRVVGSAGDAQPAPGAAPMC